MTKAQTAAVLSVGIALGAGGTRMLSSADASQLPYAHAVDLRRGFAVDGGPGDIHVLVYGTQTGPDGGHVDIGQAKKCDVDPGTHRLMEIIMYDLTKECSWDR